MYSMLRQRFGLIDLGNDIKNDLAAWQAYVLYNGGFTFDNNNPSKYLKIPNLIAARRIANVVLHRYGLFKKDIDQAIEIFASKGDITEVLKLYQHMMCQRDISHGDFDKSEEIHASSIIYSILKNVLLKVHPEFKVTEESELLKALTIVVNSKQQNMTPEQKSKCVDLVVIHERHVIVIEWKVIKIDFLEIEDAIAGPHSKFGNSRLNRALTLSKYLGANELLNVKFGKNDKWRGGKTIGEWVLGSGDDSPQSQITRYFKSPEITELVNGKVRQFHGHLVLIVGNRKVLVWDMDGDGKLRNLRLMGPWEGN
ncbi:hypothetical protein BDD12DRAFT_318297 [Trichophaea hybrida]|nr:hypothetical protein BDD12DRAFT_318297 [Trichophaea hybrida]